ncbi:MAG: ribbon-helix-helix domain-containing protein [Alphaproteobacteria bacterium]|nr:ribbon-helix-helix domain-containing protein [Alphaproteobacteria bacterium]
MTPRHEDNAPARLAALHSPEAAEIHKRSVVIAGHRTSVSVENAFWQALLEIAATRGVSANRLITEIDRDRQGNLSSAIRLFVLAEALARTIVPTSTARE